MNRVIMFGSAHRRLVAAAAAGGFVLATLTACGGGTGGGTGSSEPTGPPQRGGTLNANIPSAPSSLDPVLGGSGGDQASLFPIFDRLVNFSSTLQPAPGLATSWKYPSAKKLVLTLRHGVKFQDGTPFNAAAVKFNLDRARTLKTSTVLADLEPITSVTATSPYVVTIRLSKPDTALPLILADRAGMMASPAAVKKKGTKFALDPVGAGPFKVGKYAPGSSLTLTKNAGYWQKGKPYLDGIKLSFLTDGQTIVNSVLGGQTEFATQVGAQYAKSLKGNSQVRVKSAPSLYLDGIYMNFTNPIIKNVDARLAIQSAINSQALSNALYFGDGEAAAQIFPKAYWAYQKGLAGNLYNPAKAKTLAKKSGLTGHPLRALYYTGPNQERKAQIVQSQLAAAGIKVTLTGEEVGAGVKDFYTGHKFDIFLSGWSGRPDPGETYSSLLSPSSFYNTGGYQPSGTDIDAMIARGQSSTDQGERAAAYKPLTVMNQQQAMFIPLSFEPDVVVASPKVGGFSSILTGKDDVSFLWLKH